MAMPNLASVLEAADAQFAELSAAKADLGANYEQMQRKMGDISKLNTANAADVELVKSTELLGTIRAQENTARIAGIIGTDLNLQSNLILQYGDQMRQRGNEAKQALDVIAEKEKVGFFDNPLEYIVNQFTIGDDYAKYNAAVDQHNFASSKLKTMDALTQSGARTQAAIAQTLTNDSVAAAARSAASAATIAAEQASLESLRLGNAQIKDITTLNAQQFDNSWKQWSAVKQEEQLQLSRQSHALAQKQAELAMQERQDRITLKTENLQQQQDYITAVNKGRAIQGLPETNARALRLLEQDPKQKAQVQRWLASGLENLANGRSTIAPNPGESALVLFQSKGKTPDAAINTLLAGTANKVFSGQILQEVDGAGTKIMFDRKSPESAVAIINSQVSKAVVTMGQDIQKDPGNNIYAMPPLASIVTAEVVKRSGFYQKVLAPAMESGAVKNLDANQLASLSAAALKSGLITFDEAISGPAQIYQVGVVLNNKTKDYARVGLPAQVNAKTTLTLEQSVPFEMGRSVEINGVDAATWAQAISKINMGKVNMGITTGPVGTNAMSPR